MFREIHFKILIGFIVVILALELLYVGYIWGHIFEQWWNSPQQEVAQVIEEETPPPPPQPEPEPSIPYGKPFKVTSFGVIEDSDGKQALYVNLDSYDGSKSNVGLYISTDPSVITGYEYYGSPNYVNGYYEWEYLRNSLKNRLVWFGKGNWGIIMNKYTRKDHALIADCDKLLVQVDGKQIPSCVCASKDISWVNVKQ
jgi:hypothetical protein